MSDELELSVEELKRRVDAAASQQARVEAQQAAAEEELSRALVRLKEEFGVDSLEEAETLKLKLEAEIASEIASVQSQLSIAENTV